MVITPTASYWETPKIPTVIATLSVTEEKNYN